jgi:hypothetical protein
MGTRNPLARGGASERVAIGTCPKSERAQRFCHDYLQDILRDEREQRGYGETVGARGGDAADDGGRDIYSTATEWGGTKIYCATRENRTGTGRPLARGGDVADDGGRLSSAAARAGGRSRR